MVKTFGNCREKKLILHRMPIKKRHYKKSSAPNPLLIAFAH